MLCPPGRCHCFYFFRTINNTDGAADCSRAKPAGRKADSVATERERESTGTSSDSSSGRSRSSSSRRRRRNSHAVIIVIRIPTMLIIIVTVAVIVTSIANFTYPILRTSGY